MTQNNVHELPNLEERPNTLCSLETEQYVLAALLRSRELFSEFRGDLEPKHFFDACNRAIFESLEGYYNNQELRKRIPQHQFLINMRVPAEYVTSLTTHPVSKNTIPIYIRCLEDRWKRNEQAMAASSYLAKAEDLSIPIEESSAELEASLRQIQKQAKQTDLFCGRQDIANLLDRIDEIARGIPGDKGLSTGLSTLDDLIGGIKKGNLIVIGGMPGTGKTALAINLVNHIVFKLKKKIMFFSLEMDRSLLQRRLLAMQLDMFANKINHGPLTERETQNIVMALSNMLNHHDALAISELSTITPAKIYSLLNARGEENKPDVIFVDHLHIVSATTPQSNEVSRISSIVKELRAMVAETQIPLVLLSQLNRSADSRPANSEPKLSDLMGSSAIASDSHVVMIAQKAADEGNHPLKRDIDVHVIKNREGKTGIAQLTFTKPTFKFEDKYAQGYTYDQIGY